MGYYGQRGVDAVPGDSGRDAGQSAALRAASSISTATTAARTLRWTWKGELAGPPVRDRRRPQLRRQDQHRKGYENFVGDTLGVQGALRRDEDDTVCDFDQYAQATWHFADALVADGGRAPQRRASSIPIDHYVTGANPDDSGNVDYSATTPVAGVMWRASDIAHVYAIVRQGLRDADVQRARLSRRRRRRASRSTSCRRKAGTAKSASSCGRRRRSTRASRVFRADTDNELTIATNSGGRTTYQNIPKARRQGAEAGLQRAARRRWQLRMAFTWLDATFRSPFMTCPGTPCTTPVPVPAGTRLPGVAKQDFYTSLNGVTTSAGARTSAANTSARCRSTISTPIPRRRISSSVPASATASNISSGQLAHVLHDRQRARPQICRLGHRQRRQRTLLRAGAGTHVSCSACSGSGRAERLTAPPGISPDSRTHVPARPRAPMRCLYSGERRNRIGARETQGDAMTLRSCLVAAIVAGTCARDARVRGTKRAADAGRAAAGSGDRAPAGQRHLDDAARRPWPAAEPDSGRACRPPTAPRWKSRQTLDLANYLNAQLRRRHGERKRGESVPARRLLSRLHGVGAARHARRAFGLRRRRARQRSVRRHRQLGPDPAGGDLEGDADVGLESGVRPQHARRRADGAAPRTATTIPAASSKHPAASFGRRSLEGSNRRHGRRLRLLLRRQLFRRGRLARLLAEHA